MTKKLGKGLLVALLAMATLGCGDSEEELQFAPQDPSVYQNQNQNQNQRLTITPSALSLSPGATSQALVLNQTANGSTTVGNNGSYTFTSNNANVTVSSDGRVTVNPNATVGETAVVTAQGNGQTATTQVTVVQAGNTTGLSSGTTSYQLPAGSSSQPVQVNGTFANGSTTTVGNDSLTFTSSNPNVATVSPNGTISIPGTAANGQTATITGTDAQGQTVQFPVTVGPVQQTGIVVEPGTLAFNQGDSENYAVFGTFSDGSRTNLTNNPSVTYSSSGGSTFQNGVANGTTAGTGTETVTYTDGNQTYTTQVPYTVR